MPPFRTFIYSVLLVAAFTSYFQPEAAALHSDGVSLVAFKLKADLNNSLHYKLQDRHGYCQWQGVKCGVGGRVVRLFLPSSGLRGTFPPGTLSNLDQLRVLCLRNNSLSGPIPDLSRLYKLKSLILSRNEFSSYFPVSVVYLHRLTVLNLSYNNLTGPLPTSLLSLTDLSSLNLEFNNFNGTIPLLNQSQLIQFNVSGNQLSGPVPVTPTLFRFNESSFLNNPGLCGQLVNRACEAQPSFFGPNHNSTPPVAQVEVGGPGRAVATSSFGNIHPRRLPRNLAGLIAAIVVSLFALVLMVTVFTILIRRTRNHSPECQDSESSTAKTEHPGESITAIQSEEQISGVNVGSGRQPTGMMSGRLIFCEISGEKETQEFSLEELMSASAELLGRGTMGTTYKAVVEGRTTVTVKRLDASKTWVPSGELFEKHMAAVGRSRHSNLVPLLAYLQAERERLLVYRYHPNGSLSNLIHGSRPGRTKSLHWTSCLKIAEDVAQGLAHIHDVCKLIHGNLKSSNVLLGPDFEACITDYCLAIFLDNSVDDSDSLCLRAPENRNSNRRITIQSDVYQYGVLLLEVLTGKHPSQHPFLAPSDLLEWVGAMRDDDGGDYKQLGMLTEVASVCCLTSPEQRPSMREVIEMIHEIKERVLAEGNSTPEF